MATFIPFLNLPRLSTSNFTIYLCSTRVNLDSITLSIGKPSPYDDVIKLVELQIPPSPELPPEMLTTKNLPPHLLPILIKAFQTSKSSFLDIMNSVKPDLLIYDSFQPWAPKLASSIRKIPSVHFSTVCTTPVSFYHHTFSKGTNSPYPYEAIYLHDNEWINLTDLKSIQGSYEADDDEFMFGNFTLSTDIVLMNGSRVVEEKHRDYLSVLSGKRIMFTGPLIPNPDEEQSSEIVEWLNTQNKGSTVYISFGSECFLSDEQI
ncbi:Unknown protein [Striga hermonthica]|uniref:Uncharacterized protein n=1 Tax=Striga hermonthica TaxID=68872 RepID=A0A9N7NJT7_STRHE|nr:Unknown protein [Striga hermonthica]